MARRKKEKEMDIIKETIEKNESEEKKIEEEVKVEETNKISELNENVKEEINEEAEEKVTKEDKLVKEKEKITEKMVIFNGRKITESEFLLKKQQINSKPGMRVKEVGENEYRVEIFG